MVSIHDRTNLAPGVVNDMRDEIIEVSSRHVEIDPTAMRIDMALDGWQPRLIGDNPLHSTRRRGML